jgi:hypothetical protein
MQPGEDKIVADRLYEVLTEKRSPKTVKEMKAPAANLSGHWDVDIEFFSSESKHSWFIEQDGHWIRGSHTGDFSVRDISGSVEGDQIKLLSPAQRPNPIFIFWGTISGDSISGQINMGDYLDARFTATRHKYPEAHVPIVIPTGHLMSS